MANSESKIDTPPNWGKEPLSCFIDHATKNIFGTFHNKKAEYELLREIDDCFMTVVKNLNNPLSLLPGIFLMRAHSAYRGACRLSMSGQCPETFTLLRNCIETSLYALHIHKNAEAGEVWARRHDDTLSLRKVRTEFAYGNVSKTLEKEDPLIASTISKLYERCIDYGGHPNERAITSSMEINETEKGKEYRQTYLTGDTIELAHALKSTAQVGLGALFIFRQVYKERYDILSVTERIDMLRKQL